MSSAQIPLSGQQQFDAYSEVVAGAKAYLYLANTTTPISSYSNAALSNAHPWPVVANGSGRFPAIFIDDTPAAVRIVTTTSDGALLYEDDECPVIGPSRWAADPTPPVDPYALFTTGDFKFRPDAVSIPSFVRCNARTIGNAASGASERANADCQALFIWLYNSSSTYAVSGGRGASAAADWAANKTITLPDGRGRGPFGLDAMGNTAASRLTAANAPNTSGGAATVTLTIGELPPHNHGGAVTGSGTHEHTYEKAGSTGTNAGATPINAGGFSNTATTGGGAHSHGIPIDGSGTPHENMSPWLATGWFIKL